MAVKKKEDKLKGKEEAISLISEQINKRYGQGSFMKLGTEHMIKTDVISTGALTLDHALGVGGIPRGRISEVYGPEASGKTTLTLHIIAEAQKAGGYAAFIDAEHALDPSYAQALGVDIDNLYISQPDSGEEALEILDKVVSSSAFDVVVVDSVAALVSKSEIAGEIGDSHVALQARLMSQALRKLTSVISNTNTSVIFINQIRQNISMTGYSAGPSETTTGGRALKFFASLRIDIRKTEWIRKGEDTVGHKVKIKVVKNKLAPPFKIVILEIIFGKGISGEGLLIDLGLEAKFLSRSGSWFYYEGEQVAQGKEKLRDILAGDDRFRLELEIKIREHFEMSGVEILKEKLAEVEKGLSKKGSKTEDASKVDAKTEDASKVDASKVDAKTEDASKIDTETDAKSDSKKKTEDTATVELAKTENDNTSATTAP